MTTSHWGLAMALTVLASSVTAQDSSTAAKAGIDPQRLSRIPIRMQEFVDKGAMSGAVTLVARRGMVVNLSAVGYQPGTKTPIRTDTIFQIRSMTKSVTAVAIMILAEEGRLLLSDSVENYLPEFRGQSVVESRDGNTVRSVKRAPRATTLRDLLTHTSGMGPQAEANPGRPAFMSTLAEVVSAAAEQPLEFEPGTKWAYSDAGFLALGRIVEVVSGQPYERFVEDRILKPLGMADSFFLPPADKRRRVVGYTFENGEWRNVSPNIYGPGVRLSSPAYGMHSTASDIATFYQMMLNRGIHHGRRLLSGSSIDVMTAVHTRNLQAGFLPGMGWGLGLEIVRERVGMLSVGSFGHGNAGGSYAWVDPPKDLVGVILGGGAQVRDTFMLMVEAAVRD